MEAIIRYEIQKRKYSPNAIIGVYVDEKNIIRHDVMICFTSMAKRRGDKYANEIIDHLNRNLNPK
jgi:hypothetical protein